MIEFGLKIFVIPGLLALCIGLLALLVGVCREELLKVLEGFGKLSRPIKAGLCAIVAMLALFAGAKHGQPTNPPPDNASSPTNAPMLLGFSPRPMLLPPPEPTTNHQQPTTQITNWTARGAYCDWQPVAFSDGFQFPVGTNFIDTVTLIAYGEIKSDLHCSPSTFTYSLPSRVSLEPNASSVTHGLTPSNSYLFAWHNCCVERSATNRVDASIELFSSGAVETTVTPLSTNQPPIAIHQPPTLPEGFIGHGQDDDWIRATFLAESTNILAEGYNDWLLNTWTGINVENGHALVRVTVAALPGDGSPCYLICGPYRVNVTEPGTYAFPIEVLSPFEVRTYPTAIPLTFDFDDGYRGDGGPSFEVEDLNHPTPGPRLMMAKPDLVPWCVYRFYLRSKIVVTPNRIPLTEAVDKELRFWCNVAHQTGYYYTPSDNLSLDINGARGVIRAAYTALLCGINSCVYDEMLEGYFEIFGDSPTNENGFVTNRIDATIFYGDNWHTETLTNRFTSHHLTAVTQHDSTAPVTISHTHAMAEGQSAYVAVYMATTEPDSNPAYDDSISWSVTSNGGSSLSGSTSVFDSSPALANAVSWDNELYGVEYDPLFLGGQVFPAPSDDVLRLSLSATAQNATDGLRETCVQIVIYPVDANGGIIGLPQWVNQN